MKLLFLNYEYPPIGGGGGFISKHLAEGLAKKGHQITFLTAYFSSLEEIEKKENFTLIRVKSKRKNLFQSNPFEMLDWIKKAKIYLEENFENDDFQLVIANFVRPGGDVAYYLKMNFNLPYLLISHGHDIPWVHPRQMFFLHLLSYPKIDKIISESRLLLVQSDEMFKNATKFFSPSSRKRIVKIPNGFDENVFPFPEKKNEKFTVVFTGRLVIQKQPMLLLKALKWQPELWKNAEFHIFGDGNLKSKLMQYARQKLPGIQIVFHGKTEQKFVADMLQKAHVSVQPSLNEGMSLGIIEAVASGCKVITTKASGNNEIISDENFGSFIPFNSSKALAEKLRMYLEAFEVGKFEIDKAILLKFRKEFSWENRVEAYHQLLDSI